jgi:hypothetical protein
MVRRTLVAILLALPCLQAHGVEFAIDKTALKDIQPDEHVLAYFIGPAYYLVDSNGNNLRKLHRQKPSFFSDNFKTTIFFFLARQDAEQYKTIEENQLKTQFTVKQTALSAVLAQQYRTVGLPIEENPKLPDFILFHSFPKPVVVELLVSLETKSFYAADVGRRKYITAFFFQSDARKFQIKAETETGKKFDRVLLDFGTFLRAFMRPQAKKDVPIVVFGEDAETLVPGFEKAYARNP